PSPFGLLLFLKSASRLVHFGCFPASPGDVVVPRDSSHEPASTSQTFSALAAARPAPACRRGRQRQRRRTRGRNGRSSIVWDRGVGLAPALACRRETTAARAGTAVARSHSACYRVVHHGVRSAEAG